MIDAIIGVYTQGCVHTYIYTHMHIYIYAHTYTHTRHKGVPGVVFTRKRSGMRSPTSNITS